MTGRHGPYGRRDPLPEHCADLTAQWLGPMLARRHPGTVVEHLETVETRNTHTSKVRVAVEYNAAGRAAGLPRHLCLKGNFTGRPNPFDICRTEARFYHELAAGSAAPVPVSYLADWDADSTRGLVVLEDLVELGGEFGSTYHRIGVDGVARGLEDLAVLHARFWEAPALHAATWLPTSMDTPGDCDQPRTIWWLVEENLGREVYRERLPAWMVADPQRFLRAYDLLNEWARGRPGPTTVVHGDSHLGNTYLRPDGHRIWLDWQMARKGSGLRDVSYFVVSALTVEERRAAEHDLLAHYRDALVGAGAVDVPDLATYWEDYRRWAMYGLMAFMGTRDHWGHDNHAAIAYFATATEDLDTLALLEARRRGVAAR
ncbi:phosphotransferase family protein [Pseudonocardia pini]|uniref:phosphotransferase family protein n=1 Tax=Pseudonocardia pini TaxID=2758030 RepID=UPI0015F03AE3|nr:phosphotransferase [Pseudonocardia pini]